MNIMIATGGSGGHLIPALMVASILREEGHKVRFAGAFGDWRARVERAGFACDELNVRGLNLKNPGQALRALGLFGTATGASRRMLRRDRPEAVAGFGGYGAFPVVLAAIQEKIPTLIHEQNVVPGRANALLARWADTVTVSFPATAEAFRRRHCVLTGCPSRMPAHPLNRDAILSVSRWGLEHWRKTILVLGGSQGSHRVNELFIQVAAVLKDLINMQVIHVCGKEDYSELKDTYARFRFPFALFEFLDEMEEAYTAADLVFSRAGAVTVSELIQFRRPAILIPYPYAQGHQKKNAQVLTAAGCACLLEENKLSVGTAVDATLDMLLHTPGDDVWEKYFGNGPFKGAAESVAREIVKVAR